MNKKVLLKELEHRVSAPCMPCTTLKHLNPHENPKTDILVNLCLQSGSLLRAPTSIGTALAFKVLHYIYCL